MKATLSSTSAALSSKPSINLSRQYELNSDDEDDYDAEQGDDRGDRKKEEGWKRRLRRGIEGGMMGVGAAWIAGWAMLSLLRSS
jgi:S2P endopeptidase